MYSGNQRDAPPHPKTPLLQEETSRQHVGYSWPGLVMLMGQVKPCVLQLCDLTCESLSLPVVFPWHPAHADGSGQAWSCKDISSGRDAHSGRDGCSITLCHRL